MIVYLITWLLMLAPSLWYALRLGVEAYRMNVKTTSAGRPARPNQDTG